MYKKECPRCHRKYYENDNYCTKCGVKLEKLPNMCSEMKTTSCEHRIYADDDLYCAYCGSLTTYAKNKLCDKA